MRGTMDAAVVGRGTELGAVHQLLDDVTDGPAALVLSGVAGIGKSTLWKAGTERARQNGFAVLSCRPAAAEVRLSYAGLTDLLGVIAPDEFARLPIPQQRALDAALLRGPPDTEVPDQRATAAGFLSLLDASSVRGPTLLAIDDVQWLDDPTLRVVQFATRRCSGPIAMLLTARIADASDPTVDVIEIDPPDHARGRAVTIGPLSLGELHEVVKTHTGRSLPRRALVRIAEVSAGNPFYALELARSVGPTSTSLPAVPDTLRKAVRVRLDALGAPTMEALEVISALANPRVELVERALERSDVVERLGPAEDARVVEISGGNLRFVHPLLAEAVYTEIPPTGRRQLHRRLAGIVDDVEERARHLASSCVTDDPETTAALDEAAAQARRRGAPAAAAELLELALQLGAGNPHRLVQAAEDHYRGGDLVRARELLEQAISRLGPSALRARALAWLGSVLHQIDARPDAAEHLEQAVSEAAENPDLRAWAAMHLCWVFFHGGRCRESWWYAAMAADAAEQIDDTGLLAEALATRTIAGYLLGRGFDETSLARAVAMEDPNRPTPVHIQPSNIAALIHRWTHRLDLAQEAFARVRQRCAERGADGELRYVELWDLTTRLAAGDVAGAERLVAEHVERSHLRADTTQSRAITLTIQAYFAAWVGRNDDARSAAEEAMQLFATGAAPIFTAVVSESLGMAALSAGDFEAAAGALHPAVQSTIGIGFGEPVAVRGLADAIEALLLSGRPDEAESLIDWIEANARQPDRWWARAVGSRCRGLLQAARGELDDAEAAFEQAFAAHDRLPQLRYERARTLLAAAHVERRRGRRRAAHGYLTEAAELFDAVGAAGWAQSTRSDLDRLGLRPSGGDELTPTEQRVAELAASGMTTREVAAALIVNPKTVEAHLGRIYRKLDIHSRAELGHHFGSATTARAHSTTKPSAR